MIQALPAAILFSALTLLASLPVLATAGPRLPPCLFRPSDRDGGPPCWTASFVLAFVWVVESLAQCKSATAVLVY